MNVVTMPNIPSSLSAWVRMWQWNAQTPTCSAVGRTSTVYRSPGRDVQRVDRVRLGKREAVLGDDELRDPVQVHGVDLQALVEVVDLGPLAGLAR